MNRTEKIKPELNGTEQNSKGKIFILIHACSEILIYDNRGIIYSHSQKTLSENNTSVGYTPRGGCYTPNWKPPLCLHAKYCSVAFKYFKIMHAANAACRMPSILLAANALGC
jgi:hypothetical protein